MTAALAEVKPLISPRAAADWFLHDMAEVSGFILSGFKNMSPLSVYASYRPILTKPDPWYFAGVVALEASAITEIFTTVGADDILREIFGQMDAVVGRDDNDASALTLMLLGRLGLGSVLMGRKVPENMLSRMMIMLIGSERSLKRVMPDEDAHKQLRAALKSGKPVWWKMFARRYRLTTAPDSVIESRLTFGPSNRPQLQELPAGDPERESGLRIEALRFALQQADITLPSPANDGTTASVIDETITDDTPELASVPLTDDDIAVPEPEPAPIDDGALSLEGYRID